MFLLLLFLYKQLIEEQPPAFRLLVLSLEQLSCNIDIFKHWSQDNDTLFNLQSFIKFVLSSSRNFPDLEARMNLWALMSRTSSSKVLLLFESVDLVSLFDKIELQLSGDSEVEMYSLLKVDGLNGEKGEINSARLTFWIIGVDSRLLLPGRFSFENWFWTVGEHFWLTLYGWYWCKCDVDWTAEKLWVLVEFWMQLWFVAKLRQKISIINGELRIGGKSYENSFDFDYFGTIGSVDCSQVSLQL